ncbi:hypothetical protein [Clostridium sp.]|jgi:hypothetical protein|uniref:hypothetical protein n=1 Tax=Clostridium sp. TaxID=1506 RepID=UPI0025895FD1|nr:hypothetical protein [Clostridium sp.]MDF2505441.1 hypothetical protein [Clostridium sp.]
MSVKRNENGSVNIKNNNGSISIGRMMLVSEDRQRENYNKWIENCVKQIKVCQHTFKETINYFLEHCDALALETDDKRLKKFHKNFIRNNFQDKLEHQPQKFSFNMTYEEMENWKKENDAMEEELKNLFPEKFGLIIHGYYLPHTERNEAFYKQIYEKNAEKILHIEERKSKVNDRIHNKKIRIIHQEICFFFEETMEYIESTDGSNLIHRVIAFRGITENDIEKRTSRFFRYVNALRYMGKLPNF